MKHRQIISGNFRRIAIGAALLTAGWSANANLITNGSFELGAFVANADTGVMQLLNGSTAISGWTVLGGGGGAAGDIAWEANNNPWSFKASDGDKHLDLTGYVNDPVNVGEHGGINLTQFVPTVANQTYRLTFDMGSSKAYTDGLNPQITVLVNGTPFSYITTDGNVNLADGPGAANNHWQKEGFNFLASGPAQIQFIATTAGTDRVIELDNVSLTAVPEPSTVIAGALLLLPFGASALRVLRKTRTA